MVKTKKILRVVSFFVVGIMAISMLPNGDSANAYLTGFNAGNIMSDSVMSNKTTMTEAQIQTFLKSKNSCNKSTPSDIEYAQNYMKNNNNAVTWNIKDGRFVCMADEKFGSNGLPTTDANGETAAHIIWQAAQDYSINPQVLIVLLEKEQSLITDQWPNSNQYKKATGYGCPDTAPCDTQYFGLRSQIRWAASLFRTVLDGGWTNYPVGVNYVLYNPDHSCGGSNVNIQNRATSALYRYTPYQPNAGALAAGWGTAPCGAYGNRNFYNYFTDWFGSTQGEPTSSGLIINNSKPPTFIDDVKIPVSFTVSNPTTNTISFATIGVAVRDPDGKNLDTGWRKIDLKKGESYTYSGSFMPTSEGEYKIYISYALSDSPDVWFECSIGAPKNSCYDPVIIKRPVEITEGLSVKAEDSSASSLFHVNQSVVANFTIKNTSQKYSSDIGKLIVAGRNSSSQNADFSLTDNITLKPNESYTYTAKRRFTLLSDYRLYISQYYNNNWNESPFDEASKSLKEVNVKVSAPQVTITKGITLSSNRVGQQTISMEITNFGNTAVTYPLIGIAARDPKGNNRDPKWTKVTIDANSTYKYSVPINLDSAGKWTFFISSQASNGTWSDSNPVSDSSSIVRKQDVSVAQ